MAVLGWGGTFLRLILLSLELKKYCAHGSEMKTKFVFGAGQEILLLRILSEVENDIFDLL